MKVYVTGARWGKEKLKAAFEAAGVEIAHSMSDDIRLIIPTVDEELDFFSRNRDWFKAKGIHVNISPEFAVSTCRDKAEFALFCGRHGFNTPRTRQLGGSVAKPRFGKSGKGQVWLDNSYVVQDVVDTETFPEYSIDYFKDDNFTSIIPRLRIDVVNGESQGGVVLQDDYLINEARRLGEALGLWGHNVMQCFFDGATVIWSEVNCRYGGGSWLTFQHFNSPKYLVQRYGYPTVYS